MSTARVENRQRRVNGLPRTAEPLPGRHWARDPLFWSVVASLSVLLAVAAFRFPWTLHPAYWVAAVLWLAGTGVVLAVRPWGRATLRHPLFWLTVILVPLDGYFLYDQYQMLHPMRQHPDGTRTPGITNEAFLLAGYWAMWTALVYTALFILLDRFRASRPLTWTLTFLWGACVSTWVSIHVNTWAGQMMSTTQADAFAGARPAVFSAPFIEELAKATILILLVLLWRNHFVSRLSMVAMAGLSAAGFAFTENIIYYGRVWMQATHDISVSEPEATLHELVLLRGLYTSFGHPLFTMMTASGLVIGLGARSKIVRVLAPVGGFLLACAGHMLFNGLASTTPQEQLIGPWYICLGLVGIIVISLVVSVIGNAQLIRARLTDYEHAGWITARDAEVFGSPWQRVRLLWFALFRGPRAWWFTATLLRRVTELAYLRNTMTRGTVASAGNDRAHELILEIDELRGKALTDTAGLRLIERRSGTPRPQGRPAAPALVAYPPPQAPGPAGVGGNWPR